MTALGCDFLVCSAHKFYGPTGIGLLYGKAEVLQRLPPWLGGGEMIENVELEASTYAAPPHRFESGTSALASIAGLSAALDFLMGQDREAMAAYEQALVDYLHQQLESVAGIKSLTSGSDNIGIAAFVPEQQSGLTASDMAHLLDEKDIAVRVGHHCAQPLMKILDTQATVRVSIAAYNTREDIDRLVESLKSFLDGCGFSQTPSNRVHLQSAEVDLFNLDSFAVPTLEQLQAANGWQSRYRQLMKWGDLVNQKPTMRTAPNLVKGCESAAWLIHREEGGRHYFAVDSDSRVVKGLAVLLLVLINGKQPEVINALDLDGTFAELGLDKHLSQSRSNSFRALVDRALSFL